MQKKLFKLPPPVHGGDLFQKQRKRLRPLAANTPTNLTLKATRDFGEKAALVLSEARRLAPGAGVVIMDYAINHDHIHLAIRFPHRSNYNAYVRALTGILARKIGKGIWQFAPFTRVVGWGKPLRDFEKYLEQNRLEAAGEMPYQPRRDIYAKWRGKVAKD